MIKRFLLPAFALLACCFFANPASAASKDDASASPPSMASGDFDLSTASGAQAMLRHIRHQAVQSCRQTDYGRFLGFRYAHRDCIDAQMTRAVAIAQSATLSSNYDEYVRKGHSFAAFTRREAIYRPGEEDLARYYPATALERGASGMVRLDCVVQDDYHLSCSVASAPKTDLGWGDAALQVATTFRADRRFKNGQSTVGQHMIVPVEFRHPDDPTVRG